MKSLELAAPAPSAEVPTWSPRRLKVPARDGSLLCEPPLAEAPRLAAANAARWNRADVDLQGRSLVRLRQWARRECLRAARGYTARLIGRCGLLPWTLEGSDEVEVAYLIEKALWGQGLATEAAAAIARHAHERLGLPRLVCLILPGNAASRRVAEKIGMRRERELGPEYGGASLYARSASTAYDAELS